MCWPYSRDVHMVKVILCSLWLFSLASLNKLLARHLQTSLSLEEISVLTQVVSNFFSFLLLSYLSVILCQGTGVVIMALRKMPPPLHRVLLSLSIERLEQRVGRIVPFLAMPSLKRSVCLVVFTTFSWTSLGGQRPHPARAFAELMWRAPACQASGTLLSYCS